MKYLIVTGGECDDKFATEVIKQGGFEVIIAVDSGMELLYQMHIQPDIIVGDFDSVNPDTLEHFRSQEQIDICILDPVKDDTDTEHAIREAISRGADDITILGATGSRMDHVLGSIALLGIGLEERVDIQILDANNRIRMIDGPLTIRRDEQYGNFVSLIPYMGDVTGVTLTGFRYPLQDYTMGGFNSLGISNEIVEDEGQIDLKAGYLLVIESRD